MTLAELLKENGLSDEQIKAITDGMKANKIFTSTEENLDIRYNKLKSEFETLSSQHGESTKLIEELKKGQKDNESVQSKIGDYEAELTKLQAELEQTKKESALKVALIGAGVKSSDIDYLSFQLEKKNTELKLDDDGNIKNVQDIIGSLKTQFPSQFEADVQKKVLEKKLENPEKTNVLTKQDLLKKSYQERVAFYEEHPEEFNEIMNK